MQITSKILRVTTFGQQATNSTRALDTNRFARGTLPMKSSNGGKLPDPVVWFNGSRTENLSEKISKAFLHQRAAHPTRTDNLLTNIAVEKLGAGVSDSIANDIASELTRSERDAEDASASDPSQSDDAVEPDLIFAEGNAPVSVRSKTPLAAGKRPAGRTKLAGVDLWTIVFGTLVLSIGAQYVLQGFGLAPI